MLVSKIFRFSIKLIKPSWKNLWYNNLMSFTFVTSLDKEEQQQLKNRVRPHLVENRIPFAQWMARMKKSKTTIILYKSGKVVIQGESAQTVATKLGLSDGSQDDEPYATTYQPKKKQILIGTDEVGNGSYFGGIAVVASYVRPEDHAWLRRLGVGDSKTMTDQKIREIAPILEEKIPHKALLLNPEKYNQVVGEGRKHNAVSVKVALHNQAIFLLLQQVESPEAIVIDAFTSDTHYKRYLQREVNQFSQPISLVQKAESQYLAVAVSSIIARKLFLDNLEELGQQVIGRALPSGASKPSDLVAAQILKEKGMEGLAHVAKLHFKNTEKAQAFLTEK